MTTICGMCETEWRTDTGRQVCPKCGNDGEYEGHVVREDRRAMTKAQLEMLRALWHQVERSKRQGHSGWQEMASLVDDTRICRSYYLAWYAANKVLSALDRRGYLEHHAEYDDLVRVSASGVSELRSLGALSGLSTETQAIGGAR